MPAVGVKTADQRRADYRARLQEYLRDRGIADYVIDTITKLHNLENDLDALQVTRLKASAELSLGLLKKILPDLKATEITGENGGAVRIVAAKDDLNL